MPVEKCKLCLEEKDLQHSHLMPAAVFKALRARQNPNPNPLAMDGDWLGQTSDQVAQYEFCRECEHRFNAGGEDWVLPLLATLDGFLLFDMLAKAPTLEKDGEYFACPASGIPDFDLAKMIHFAMAIFWKASVRNWAKKGNEIQIRLGPYAEPFRQFVRGVAPFPANTYLAVCVLPPTVPLLSTLMPVQLMTKGFHCFTFYVPGVEFQLYVGKNVPDSLKIGCIATGQHHLVLSSPDFAKTIGKNYVNALKSARISPGYANYLKERGRKS
jgi:hypothetical protein